MLLQFKLAWAITAHKIQGQTIAKPRKLVVDLRRVFEAAQAYVMLSRVQELDQLIIVESLPREKIYPSQQALTELERMNKDALNKSEDNHNYDDKIISVNIRSLRAHYEDLLSEQQLKSCDAILIQQTCLEATEPTTKYQLENFASEFNSVGNGKGLAHFFTPKFQPVLGITEHPFQMSKLESKHYDIISVYRSSDSSETSQIVFCRSLINIINSKNKTFIIGDFNLNAIDDRSNMISKELSKLGFRQLVQEPTHIQGGLIDHCYVSHNILPTNVRINQKSVYYTDHDMIEILYTNDV